MIPHPFRSKRGPKALEGRVSRPDEPRGSPIACNGGYGEGRATIYPKGGRLRPVACLLSLPGRASSSLVQRQGGLRQSCPRLSGAKATGRISLRGGKAPSPAGLTARPRGCFSIAAGLVGVGARPHTGKAGSLWPTWWAWRFVAILGATVGLGSWGIPHRCARASYSLAPVSHLSGGSVSWKTLPLSCVSGPRLPIL